MSLELLARGMLSMDNKCLFASFLVVTLIFGLCDAL